MNQTTLQNHADKLVQQCLVTASKKLGIDFDDIPVSLDLRGRTAGQFCYRKNAFTGIVTPTKIRLNRVLFQENFGDFDQTIIHETAHYIASMAYGGNIQPHGTEWKRVMLMLGVDPKRCHNYDVSNAQTRQKSKFKYKCGCQEHVVGPVRHKKMQRGGTYICRQCKEKIVFVAAAGQVSYAQAMAKTPAKKAATPKKPVAKKVATNKSSLTKKEQSMIVYKLMVSKGAQRKEIIARFVSELNMTPAGAATYYANCKKEVK